MDVGINVEHDVFYSNFDVISHRHSSQMSMVIQINFHKSDSIKYVNAKGYCQANYPKMC